jgi:RimJ/RimL family protein N-acetyltransferase
VRDEVVLRDVTEADLPLFYEHQLDPVAVRLVAFRSRDWEAFLDHWGRILADPSIEKQTIEVDGRAVGFLVSFVRIEVLEVGYWIGREHWGRGITSRALSMFLEHVKTRPLYARVAEHNDASMRVLEKCGFRRCDEGQGAAPAEDGVVETLWKLDSEQCSTESDTVRITEQCSTESDTVRITEAIGSRPRSSS